MNRLKILHIEDTETDVHLVLRTLKRAGYEVNVHRVDTEADLRDVLSAQAWDLIFTDYSLPGFDGLAALEMVRRLSPLTPCIFLTGTMGEDVAVEVMRAGAADFIVKNNLARLVPAVERELREAVVRRRQVRLERFNNELHGILELLAGGKPLPEILDALACLIEREIPDSRCALFLAESRERLRLVAAPGLPVECRLWLDTVPIRATGPACARAAFHGAEQTNEIASAVGGNSAAELADGLRAGLAAAGRTHVVALPVWADEVSPSREKDCAAFPEIVGAVELYLSDAPTQGVPGIHGVDTQEILSAVLRLMRVALKRQRDEQARLEAETRLRMVLAHLPVIVWAADGDGRITFMDGRGLKDLGLRGEDFLTADIFDFFDGSLNVQTNIALAFAGEQQSWETVRGDVILETHVTRITTDQGVMLIGITAEITERRRIQDRLIRSEKLAAMGELIAGVVHELNNPLTVISTIAQLLSLDADESIARDADTIRRMTARMSRTVRSLLDFSRRDGNEKALASVNEIVTAALDIARLGLKREGIELEADLAEGLPPICVNGHKIEQVLVNLIRNAQYALRGREHRMVRVETRGGTGGGIQIRISDTGGGIPPEILGRIFEPFFTTKPAGEGTGLGLSICQGIAAEHHGTLTVESTPGAGATFTLSLPTPLSTGEDDNAAE